MIVRVGNKLAISMFLNEKLTDLYLSITSGPLNYVCGKLDMNYSHAINLINIWESMGLIIKNKSGYRYNMFYTPRGKTLFDYLTKLKAYLKRSNVQWVG